MLFFFFFLWGGGVGGGGESETWIHRQTSHSSRWLWLWWTNLYQKSSSRWLAYLLCLSDFESFVFCDQLYNAITWGWYSRRRYCVGPSVCLSQGDFFFFNGIMLKLFVLTTKKSVPVKVLTGKDYQNLVLKV